MFWSSLVSLFAWNIPTFHSNCRRQGPPFWMEPFLGTFQTWTSHEIQWIQRAAKPEISVKRFMEVKGLQKFTRIKHAVKHALNSSNLFKSLQAFYIFYGISMEPSTAAWNLSLKLRSLISCIFWPHCLASLPDLTGVVSLEYLKSCGTMSSYHTGTVAPWSLFVRPQALLLIGNIWKYDQHMRIWSYKYRIGVSLCLRLRH